MRNNTNKRTLSGTALEDLLANLMDEDLKAYKLLNRPLFDSHPQARKIINSGGGGKKKSAAA